MRKSLWLACGPAALAVLLAAPALAIVSAGKPAPTWVGKTTTGKTLGSPQLKGKVVVLNFFNNYCSTCREEYPHLQQLQKQHASRGFTVVSVSNDETAAEAGNFAREVKATFPVVHDPKNVVYGMFDVTAVPANIVLDRKGRVVAVIESADVAKLKAAVSKALAVK